MAPLDPEDAKQWYGGSGEFASLRKLLKPGASVEFHLVDIAKNFKTKFPIKDKDYGYRVTVVDDQQKRLLIDLAGKSLIGQFVTALYPEGPEHPPVPCRVKITRRTERTMTQSEYVVERMETDGDSSHLPI